MAGKSTYNPFPEERPRLFLRREEEPQQDLRQPFLHITAAQNTNHQQYVMQNHTTSNTTNNSRFNFRTQRLPQAARGGDGHQLLNSNIDMRIQQLPQRTAPQGGGNHQFRLHEPNLSELLVFNSAAHNSHHLHYVMPNYTKNNNNNRIANIIRNSHTDQIQIQQLPQNVAAQGGNHQQLGQHHQNLPHSFHHYPAEQSISHQEQYTMLSDFEIDHVLNQQYPQNQQNLSMAEGETTPQDIDDLLETLPPGYRFVPSNEQLVKDYLMKKVKDKPVPCKGIIHEVNFSGSDPRELIERYRGFEGCWYYFTPRGKKYPNGLRPNRRASNGYWKATGKDDPIFSNDDIIGNKLVLDFYQGVYPKGEKTGLKMHEFIVHKKCKNAQSISTSQTSMQLDQWVLCKIYKARRGGNGDDQQSGGDDSVVDVDDNTAATPEEESPLNSLPTTVAAAGATATTNHHNNNNNVMQQNNVKNDTPNGICWEKASTSTLIDSCGIACDEDFFDACVKTQLKLLDCKDVDQEGIWSEILDNLNFEH